MNTNLTPSGLAAYFDYTQLRIYAVRDGFVKLYEESMECGFKMVVINPVQVARCKELLKGSLVYVGVMIDFPLGQTTTVDKINETKTAIGNGSNEIGYVISITELKEGNYNYVEKEMTGIVGICRENHIISKVTFENCYLTKAEKEELCKTVFNIKPGFIKTSTGFGTGRTASEDIALMKRMAGDKTTIKAVGGARDLDTALKLIGLGVSRIGSTASVTILEEYKSRL